MKMIKAIIFDLDDTLFDTTNQLVENAQREALKAMIEAGLPISLAAALELKEKILKKKGPQISLAREVCSELDVQDEKILKAGLDAYHGSRVEKIELFPDVVPTLKELRQKGVKLAIVSHGRTERQNEKIDALGIREHFDFVIIDDSAVCEKRMCFEEAIKKLGVKPQEILSVGDKIREEVKESNSLGMATARMLHGRHSELKPSSKLEMPDYEIKAIQELLELV